MRTQVAAATLLFVAVATGCAVGDVEPTGDEDDTGDDSVAGRYELTSRYDLSTSDALPGMLGAVLDPLTNLRDDPGGTLFDILESRGGGLANLLDLLGPGVRADLEQRINDYVADQIANGGIAGEVVVWVDEIAGILTDFEVVSQFEVGKATDGLATGDHTLTGVRFTFEGERRDVAVAEIVSSLTIARGVDVEIDGSRIIFADHGFRFPLGELAVTGINKFLDAKLGAGDISEALGLVLDCPALAADVGPVCLGDFCIDDQQIADLCTSAVDAVAGELEDAIASIDFAELQMNGGRASLASDRWDGGTWQSAFDIDGLVLPVEASFTASRMP